MTTTPGTWYVLGELLSPRPTLLADGSRIYSGKGFAGGNLEVLSGHVTDSEGIPYPFVQVCLRDIDRAIVSGLPDSATLMKRLLAEAEFLVSGAHFPFELVIACGERTCVAKPLVCASLALTASSGGSLEHSQQMEVENAWQRGWLDEPLRAKADFRIGARPLAHKIRALTGSGYVPLEESAIDIVFAQWRDASSNEPLLTPLDADREIADVMVQFRAARRTAGFRVSDLFSANR
ncbi:MAG: hypothetical protein KDI19_04690 [Pseudomonadales bacterium]|nr:hypothetical protein [Pseudomonadales bacterium]